MDQNYQKQTDIVIDKIKKNGIRPKLMLHSCCAPCSSYVLEYLSKYFNITVFYYNPNIDDEIEYNKRLEEQKRFIKTFNMNLKDGEKVSLIEGEYLVDDFYTLASGLENENEGGKRCYRCYELRMLKTAIKAKEFEFDYFSTVLSISPHKNVKMINTIGKDLQERYNINFLFGDFKKRNGYKRSIELSEKYNLYRQNYCGCSFSKKVRGIENE